MSAGLILSAGPFLPGRPPAWRHGLFLAALAPLAAWRIALAGPPEAARLGLAVLAGLAALIVAGRERKRALGDLGWAAAALAVTLWQPLQPGPAGLAAFVAALLASQPRLAKMPPTPALWGALAAAAWGGAPAAPPPSWEVYGGLALVPVVVLGLCRRPQGWRELIALILPVGLLAAAFGREAGSLLGQAFLTLPVLVWPAAACFRRAWAGPLLALAVAPGLLLAPAAVSWPALAAPVLAAWCWRRFRGPGFAPAGRPVPPPSNLVARLACAGRGAAARPAVWAGPGGCRLVSRADYGPFLCRQACLGLGDCLRACPHGAIRYSLSGGALYVDEKACRGCGACLAACPQRLLSLGPRGFGAFIPCAGRAPLKEAARACPEGCLGCGRCRKACPARAIYREAASGAMTVDRELCLAYGPACGRVCGAGCPRGLLA